MKAILSTVIIVCAAISGTAVAQQTVTCESIDSARNECEMNTRGVVEMVQQLSHSPCREGSDWGLSKHGVWVDNGCRAVFENRGTGGGYNGYRQGGGGSSSANRVTCESIDSARNECEMNTRGVVEMAEQLSHSPCREGTDWGLSKHGVWVDNGCRAVFENRGTGRGY